jgi:hypothetical protein
VLPRDLGNRNAVSLAQNRKHLLFGESNFFICSSLHQREPLSQVKNGPKNPGRSTPTQALLLRAATRRADGRVIAPANLRGGARVNALSGLLRRE